MYFARHCDEAIQHPRTALSLEPDYSVLQVFLGMALEQRGDHVGAVAAIEKWVTKDRNNDDLCQLAHAYATAGRRQDAERMITEILEPRKTGFMPACNIALAYAGLGDHDEAFHWLDLALGDHSEMLTWLKVDPGYDPLRSDPRFEKILRRVNLAP